MAMGQAEYAYETTNGAPRLTLKLNSLRLPEIAENKTASVPTGTGTQPLSAAVPPKTTLRSRMRSKSSPCCPICAS